MNSRFLMLIVAISLGGCRPATESLATPDPVGVEAPWDHHYLSKPFAVNLCDLSKSATVVVLGKVSKTTPIDDPGGFFSDSPNGGNGQVTLIEVTVEAELAGTLGSKTFTIEVPGRATPVPGAAAPSTMVPDVAVGEKAVLFLVPNSKNPNFWILKYAWESYFPVGSSGKISNGYTYTHPPKELTSFLLELQATIQSGKTCVGNLDIYAQAVDAGSNDADTGDGDGAMSPDADAPVSGADLKP
jgi:hypothetical protein